jgi:hypothetical protein
MFILDWKWFKNKYGVVDNLNGFPLLFGEVVGVFF